MDDSKIIDDVSIKSISKLPNEIRNLSYKIISIDSQLNDIREKRDTIKLKMINEIKSEKDEDGKFKFNNDSKREEELINRLSINNNFNYVNNQFKQLEKSKKQATIELKYKENLLLQYDIITRGV